MISYFLLDSAEEEFKKSFDFYDSISIDLGNKFLSVVYDSFDLICKDPNIWPIKYNQQREFILFNFPYTIIYIYEASYNQEFIISIFHHSRDPNNKPFLK